MFKKATIASVLVLIAAQTLPLAPAQARGLKAETRQHSVGLLIPAVQAFTALPRTSQGTCSQSGEWGCDMDEFIAGCEETGGLSTEPGGGISCDLAPID